MKIIKFGGTSIGNADSIRSILDIVRNMRAWDEKPVVVLSAMAGITNLLNQLAEDASTGKDFSEGLQEIERRHFSVIRELIPVSKQNPLLTEIRLLVNELERILTGIASLRELSLRSRDLVLSFGERCAAFIISKIAGDAVFVDARNLIRTDSQFGNAHVDMDVTSAQVLEFAQAHSDQVWFITGFIAMDGHGQTTTLGRGGSDYTAALLGSILEADAIEIWTDVDGMLTADPNLVKKAFSLHELSYAEAMELSYFGAKVIYPPTMLPVFQKQIPIVIRNTFNPEFLGTTIRPEVRSGTMPIKGISSINKVSLINLAGSGMVGRIGFSGRLFALMARERINIILITQSSSEHSITFAVQPQDIQRTKELIEREFELEFVTGKLAKPQVEEDLSILAIVGENMKRTPGMSGKLFNALGRNGINVRAIAQGSSELNISVIISQSDLSKALNAVHDAFFAELNKTLHVFSLGTGNIGATFFDQLHAQHDFLRDNNDIEIKVVGISNSRKMLLDPQGIMLENWRDDLNNTGIQADLEVFIQEMQQLNLPNCVFVDNTASRQVTTHYEQIFQSNISIVTSNKIANSGSYEQYRLLKETARKQGVDFLYETNVGAGLPIIRVLQDLMLSGDQVLKIEAILSGTISYIFNNYTGDTTFYDVVKNAQSLGFTEPDPRDDLSGIDFMRKMLILGRDAGFPMEADHVFLGAIMPESCLQAPTVAQFYETLIQEEAHFSSLKRKAESQGGALRYVGKLEDGRIHIDLQVVGNEHPFYALSGSDNIISFTTERYKDNPLIVKGPGAGSAVTSAGVFADLVHVGTR